MASSDFVVEVYNLETMGTPSSLRDAQPTVDTTTPPAEFKTTQIREVSVAKRSVALQESVSQRERDPSAEDDVPSNQYQHYRP